MHSFYKNKKPGKQCVFRKKKDAKKGSGGVGGPCRRKVAYLVRVVCHVILNYVYLCEFT
jgi:hypothetical protein